MRKKLPIFRATALAALLVLLMVVGGGTGAAFTPSDAYSWGTDKNSQLSHSPSGLTQNPTPGPMIGLSNVVKLDGGEFHTLALRSDGTVWASGNCWQSAQVGQIRTREDYYYEELRGSSLRVLL